MVLAGGERGELSAHLSRLLDEYVEAQYLGVECKAQAGFLLQKDPNTVRAPDAFFVAAADLLPAGIPKDYRPFAPDPTVEVIAPADRFEAIQTKVAEYFSVGPGDNDELRGGDVIDGSRCPVKRVFD